MSLIRVRRLASDAKALERMLAEPMGRVLRLMDRYGEPPHAYRIQVNLPGVAGLWTASVDPKTHERRGLFAIRHRHTLIIRFPADYPFRPPEVAFAEGLYHPNVYANGRLCWGRAEEDARWWRGGEGLDILVERLLHLIVGTPSCVNLNSPANVATLEAWRTGQRHFPLAALPRRLGFEEDRL